LLTTGYPPFSVLLLLAGDVLFWGCGGGAGGGGGGPGAARNRPCGAARRSCAGAGPLPRAGAQLPVHCVLLLGGVAGAGAGRRRMPRGRWRPAFGGRPHRRPPRRRASPAPFFLADCGGLSVGWVFCHGGRDRWGGERVVDGCYPALTLAPTCEVRFGGVLLFILGSSFGGVGPVRGLRGGERGGWCEESARSG
jgi:hypothetical protein